MRSNLAKTIDRITSLKMPDMAVIQSNLEAEERFRESLKRDMETHPANAELSYLKGWVERLKQDEQHHTFLLDYMLVPGNLQKDRMMFVEKFHDASFIANIIRTVANHMKGELPNRDELNVLLELRHRLDEDNIYDPDIVHFIEDIKRFTGELLILKNRYPGSKALNDLLNTVHRAQHADHLTKYVGEIHMFQDLLNRLEHDDPSWTFFREKLYKENEVYAKIITKRYRDPGTAKRFVNFFKANKEDRNGTIALLKSIIRYMSSPKARMEEEHKAVDELKRIIEHAIKFQRSQLEALRKDVMNLCATRAKELDKNKSKIIKLADRRKKKERALLQNIAALGLKLDDTSDPAALHEANTTFGQPGQVEPGIRLMHAHVLEGKLSLYTFARILDSLIKQREAYNKQAHERRDYFYKTGQLDPKTMTEIRNLDHSMTWYGKEIIRLGKELHRVMRQVDQTQRYQMIELKKLDKLLKSSKELKKFKEQPPVEVLQFPSVDKVA